MKQNNPPARVVLFILRKNQVHSGIMPLFPQIPWR